MEDNLSKFLKIAGLVLLSLMAFVLAIVLIILGLRTLFGLFGHMTWVVLVYKMVILVLPAALFIMVYLLFFRVTRRHVSKWARLVSYFLFSVAILSWVYAYGTDLLGFIRKSSADISAGSTVRDYLSYNSYFLSAHVLCLILTGVLQALAAPDEKDWLEKAHQNREFH